MIQGSCPFSLQLFGPKRLALALGPPGEPARRSRCRPWRLGPRLTSAPALRTCCSALPQRNQKSAGMPDSQICRGHAGAGQRGIDVCPGCQAPHLAQMQRAWPGLACFKHRRQDEVPVLWSIGPLALLPEPASGDGDGHSQGPHLLVLRSRSLLCAVSTYLVDMVEMFRSHLQPL